MLPAAGFRRQLEGSRVKIEIPSPQLNHRVRRIPCRSPSLAPRSREGGIHAGHTTSADAGGAMQPGIRSPLKGVEQGLNVELIGGVGRIVCGKSGEHRLPKIGDTIPVGVLGVDDIRCDTDEDAAIPTRHRRRPGQAVQKHGRPIIPPIAIDILKPPDASQLLRPSLRVIPHLHNIRPAPLVHRHGDRTRYQRLGRDQLGVKAGSHLERGHRLVGLRGGIPGHLCGGDRRFGRAASKNSHHSCHRQDRNRS